MSTQQAQKTHLLHYVSFVCHMCAYYFSTYSLCRMSPLVLKSDIPSALWLKQESEKIKNFKEGSANRNDGMPVLPLNWHIYIVQTKP